MIFDWIGSPLIDLFTLLDSIIPAGPWARSSVSPLYFWLLAFVSERCPPRGWGEGMDGACAYWQRRQTVEDFLAQCVMDTLGLIQPTATRVAIRVPLRDGKQ